MAQPRWTLEKVFGKLADLKVELEDSVPVDDRIGRLINDMPVIRKYVNNRRENPTLPAIRAWEWAKSTGAMRGNEPEGFNTNGHSFEVDGFDIRINEEPDTDPDCSFLGEFVNHDQDGAVKNPEAWTSHGNRNPHFMPYFVPTYSEAERFADLQMRGFDKQSAHLEARRQILKDLDAARDYSAVVIIVTASRNRIELGSDVLGGVEYDYTDQAVFDHGMIDNAISEAIKKLEELRAEGESK